MAAKSIMEVDNPAQNSRRKNTRNNRSFHNNSKQTAENCKQIKEETPIEYAEPQFRGKQSFGDRSPHVSSKNWNNSKQTTSMASQSTVSQNSIAFSRFFFKLPSFLLKFRENSTFS